jgi:hypothetical protein
MVSRVFLVWLIAWTSATPWAAAGPAPGGQSPVTTHPGDKAVPAGAQQAPSEPPSTEDEELIKNLDLVEHLDLLDTAEALGVVSTPDTPEEEF